MTPIRHLFSVWHLLNFISGLWTKSLDLNFFKFKLFGFTRVGFFFLPVINHWSQLRLTACTWASKEPLNQTELKETHNSITPSTSWSKLSDLVTQCCTSSLSYNLISSSLYLKHILVNLKQFFAGGRNHSYALTGLNLCLDTYKQPSELKISSPNL